MDYKLIIQSCV